MPSKVEIGIFNIARTQVDREEVQKWLDCVGVSEDYEIPEDGAISNPALLIALAAKRCYKSFEVNKSLNPNLTQVRKDWDEYLTNVLKVGHGSVLEHSVFTFAIENISRVFTAEMNRHRAGWAISEGSLRFIRFGENIPYWEPDSIRGSDVFKPADTAEVTMALLEDMENPLEQSDIAEIVTELKNKSTFRSVVECRREIKVLLDKVLASVPQEQQLDARKHLSRQIFEWAFEEQEQSYRVLEAVWDMDEGDKNFDYKKKVTSMMRRIIGLGVATGGVWSGNVRALRHVITMRCEPWAEEEMLHVFGRIALRMKEQEPMLFGDFYQDDQGFWRPKYKKV